MTVDEKVEKKLVEAYIHVKPYIQQHGELKEMCKNCECWIGKDHDYDECRDNQCFRFWLAFVYLHWETSWG